MEFHKFHSIENSYREKTLQQIKDYVSPKEEWCITEKIHGSNFSFSTDGKEVIAGKRTSFLKTKQERDFFMNCDYIYELYRERVIKAFNLLNVNHITIYGELFGGYYECAGVSKLKQFPTVQKGVHYSPKHHFFAYDIYVHDTNSYLPYLEVIRVLQEAGIPYLEILYRGSLTECLVWSEKHCEDQTTIPEKFGLPEIKDNVREGHVLKPIIPLRFPNGESVVLKHKNDRFKETCSVKKVAVKDLSDKIQKLVDTACSYITVQRLVY